MRHDYDLPPDWEAMNREEKDSWFKQERARRQARNQDTNYSRRAEKEEERRRRRAEARSESTQIEP